MGAVPHCPLTFGRGALHNLAALRHKRHRTALRDRWGGGRCFGGAGQTDPRRTWLPTVSCRRMQPSSLLLMAVAFGRTRPRAGRMRGKVGRRTWAWPPAATAGELAGWLAGWQAGPQQPLAVCVSWRARQLVRAGCASRLAAEASGALSLPVWTVRGGRTWCTSVLHSHHCSSAATRLLCACNTPPRRCALRNSPLPAPHGHPAPHPRALPRLRLASACSCLGGPWRSGPRVHPRVPHAGARAQLEAPAHRRAGPQPQPHHRPHQAARVTAPHRRQHARGQAQRSIGPLPAQALQRRRVGRGRGGSAWG